MKALTFVGLRTGDGYRTARYSHEGRVVESNLFPIALYEFFRPGRMIVFVTKESRQRYWQGWKQGPTEVSEMTQRAQIQLEIFDKCGGFVPFCEKGWCVSRR
jgi:hypothetical protein